MIPGFLFNHLVSHLWDPTFVLQVGGVSYIPDRLGNNVPYSYTSVTEVDD